MKGKIKNFFSTWQVKAFLAAVIIRVLVGGLFYHTDTKALYRDAALMDLGVKRGYEQAFRKESPLFYPPLVYMGFNWYQKVARPLLSDYYPQWMQDWGTLHTVKHPEIFRDLLVMKLPFLLADLLLTIVLMKLVSKEKRKLISYIWLLNPISIYSIYVIGQFDILTTLLIAGGLLSWDKQRTLSYLAVGLASTVKLYPLMLFPLMFLLDDNRWWKRIGGVLAGGAVFLASLVPILSSAIARNSVFKYNLNRGTFMAGWEIGGKEFLSIFMIWYAVVLYLAIRDKLKGKLNLGMVLIWAGLFGLSHFHPQWIVWVLPFLLILGVEEKVSWSSLLGAGMCFWGVTFLIDDKFMSWGSLKAVNNAFDSLQSIRFWFDRLGLGVRAQDFFHSLLLVFLAAICLEAVGVIKKKELWVEWKIKGWQRARTWLVLWLGFLTTVILLAHIPLTIRGAYLSQEKMSPDAVVEIKQGEVLEQDLQIKNNGFNSLQVRAKNINLSFSGKVGFEIVKEGEVLRRVEVPGGIIRDDYDLWVKFKGIPESRGKTYGLRVFLVEDPADSGLVFGYEEDKEGLFKNSKDLGGMLSYRIYYNPGGYWKNLQFSLANIWDKSF